MAKTNRNDNCLTATECQAKSRHRCPSSRNCLLLCFFLGKDIKFYSIYLLENKGQAKQMPWQAVEVKYSKRLFGHCDRLRIRPGGNCLIWLDLCSRKKNIKNWWFKFRGSLISVSLCIINESLGCCLPVSERERERDRKKHILFLWYDLGLTLCISLVCNQLSC